MKAHNTSSSSNSHSSSNNSGWVLPSWYSKFPEWFVIDSCVQILWTMIIGQSVSEGFPAVEARYTDEIDRIIDGDKELDIDFVLTLAQAINPGASDEVVMGFLRGMIETVAVHHLIPILTREQFYLEYPEATARAIAKLVLEDIANVEYRGLRFRDL